MAIFKQRKSDTGQTKAKMKGLTVKDLLIPGLFGLILLLLTLFVYVPSITEANKLRGEIKDVQQRQKLLRDNLDALQPLIDDKVQLQKDLRKTQKIIPRQLEVADFSYYVDKLARDSGLEFKEITQANTSKSTDEQGAASGQNFGSYVSGITGPIVYEGSFSQIVEFLDQLQQKSPYMIQATNLELSGKDTTETGRITSDLWLIELNITGYFINQEADVSLADITNKIVPYTKNSDLLTIFEYKNTILESTE
ncbi:hypothetical protein H6763_01620 [Candidatus Nomurabacteria bacterium]|uniref:Uncharacterized protein n=1 Tax=Candidatus Dojkabacteria bacterium TaxID=2099670 RepID=A0A955I1P8_9BACT|nr:hypothetical protein [Candidatus Dojkabacteria bacterium]MCB9789871.1 hypothetical protein [Candidatus Nomurabacteria bacterium]MCB9803505.1 hypothetical protein [Candidatus Nomurabacteria bacterium]